MPTNFTLPQLSARVRELTRQRAMTFLSRLLRQGVIDADDYRALWDDYLKFHRGGKSKRTTIKREAEAYDDEQASSGVQGDAKSPPYHYLKQRAFYKKMMDLQSSGKITPDLRVRYVQQYEEYHKQLKASGTHKSIARRHWSGIKEQLADEIASVRTGILYYRKADRNSSYEARERAVAHQRAYERYLAVLLKTSNLMRNAIRAGTTPLQLVDLMAKEGMHVPNEGAHWTDWVPPKTKRAVIMEFAALPHTERAKRRHPFERPERTEAVQATITHAHLATELPPRNPDPDHDHQPGEISHQTHEGE